MTSLSDKMRRDPRYYDVRIHDVPEGRYVIMYNGVDWSLNFRTHHSYHQLGNYGTPELADAARLEHRKAFLIEQIAKCKEELQ